MNMLLTPAHCKAITSTVKAIDPYSMLKSGRLPDVHYIDLQMVMAPAKRMHEFGAWPTDAYKVLSFHADEYIASDSFEWTHRPECRKCVSEKVWKQDVVLAGCEVATIDVQDPHGEECFDVVVSVSVIEHVLDHEKAVKNIYRSLRKGGKFIFTTELNLFEYLPYRHDIYFRVYTPEAILQLLRNAGFTVDTEIMYNADDPFISEMAKARGKPELLIHPYKHFCSAGFEATK